MSPKTAKFRVELPLTERWLVVNGHIGRGGGTPYRNPKRAAAKAEREARLAANRKHARSTKPYRGPRVADSQWAEAGR